VLLVLADTKRFPPPPFHHSTFSTAQVTAILNSNAKAALEAAASAAAAAAATAQTAHAEHVAAITAAHAAAIAQLEATHTASLREQRAQDAAAAAAAQQDADQVWTQKRDAVAAQLQAARQRIADMEGEAVAAAAQADSDLKAALAAAGAVHATEVERWSGLLQAAGQWSPGDGLGKGGEKVTGRGGGLEDEP
jgi:hypothetical protein